MTSSRLARKLSTFDALVIGLAAMLGAGIFAVVGPAVKQAGALGALLGLLVAGAVAYCNALASAQLAALHPESGGAYVYGRKRLGHFWGYLAGWAFVVGKVSSCAAMALTFAAYAAPGWMRPLAIAAVIVLTLVNYLGIQKTAWLTRGILALVLLALILVVFANLFGGQADIQRLKPSADFSIYGLLQAAGLWFFAFAGYARLATLGEEVRDPARTLTKAIPLALGLALALYALVALSALLALEPGILAETAAPLVAAVEAGHWAGWSPAVRLGAALASLGVLLSLIAGVSRTFFAMAAKRDMPHYFSRVHHRYRIPHRAELAVGATVCLLLAFADLAEAIGFSAFLLLCYYAVANAAAWRLDASERRWPRWLSLAGLAGCLLLAFSLPLPSVLAGVSVLVLAALVFGLRHWLIGQDGDF